MREIRPSGSEGGVARKRHPYPYQTLRDFGAASCFAEGTWAAPLALQGAPGLAVRAVLFQNGARFHRRDNAAGGKTHERRCGTRPDLGRGRECAKLVAI